MFTTEKDEIATNFHAIEGQLFDTGEPEAAQSRLQEELNVVAELIQQCARENAHAVLDQTEYQARYSGLAERFDQTKARLDEAGNAITEKQAKKKQIGKMSVLPARIGRRLKCKSPAAHTPTEDFS